MHLTYNQSKDVFNAFMTTVTVIWSCFPDTVLESLSLTVVQSHIKTLPFNVVLSNYNDQPVTTALKL